jgi:hypothetical protein
MHTPEACLVTLQRSVTADDLWTATRALMEAVVPGRYYVLGLPSLGVMPMFLRTTMPTRDLGRFAELAPLNRVIATRPGLAVARMSDFYTATPDDPFYKEFLVPDGWLHSVALIFWSRDGRFIGHLASLRSAEQGDYSEAELGHLHTLHPQVNAAMKRVLDLQNAAATQITLERSLHALPLPLAVVAWDLSLAFINKAGRTTLQSWLHGAGRSRALKPTPSVLPQCLSDACLLLKASMSDAVRAHDFRSLQREVTVVHPTEPAMSATIRLVEPPSGRAMQPSWILHFETVMPQNGEVAHALLQFTKLSPAERNIALLAAAAARQAENPGLVRAAEFPFPVRRAGTHRRHPQVSLG